MPVRTSRRLSTLHNDRPTLQYDYYPTRASQQKSNNGSLVYLASNQSHLVYSPVDNKLTPPEDELVVKMIHSSGIDHAVPIDSLKANEYVKFFSQKQLGLTRFEERYQKLSGLVSFTIVLYNLMRTTATALLPDVVKASDIKGAEKVEESPKKAAFSSSVYDVSARLDSMGTLDAKLRTMIAQLGLRAKQLKVEISPDYSELGLSDELLKFFQNTPMAASWKYDVSVLPVLGTVLEPSDPEQKARLEYVQFLNSLCDRLFWFIHEAQNVRKKNSVQPINGEINTKESNAVFGIINKSKTYPQQDRSTYSCVMLEALAARYAFILFSEGYFINTSDLSEKLAKIGAPGDKPGSLGKEYSLDKDKNLSEILASFTLLQGPAPTADKPTVLASAYPTKEDSSQVGGRDGQQKTKPALVAGGYYHPVYYGGIPRDVPRRIPGRIPDRLVPSRLPAGIFRRPPKPKRKS